MGNPKIILRLTILDKTIEILTGFLLFFIWGWLLYHYPTLPEKIPTHFNFAGEADGFGHKNSLFVLTILATIIYTLLSVIKKFPHILNYPVTITEENASKLYHLSNQMLRYLKFLTILVLSVIEVFNINITKNNADTLPNSLIFGIISLIFISTTYFIIKMFMISKKNS